MPINELRVSGSKLEPPSRPSQDWSKQRPYFGQQVERNLTVELGKTAHLTCKVFELGDKTVSWLRPRQNEILTAGRYTYIGDSRISSMNENGSPEWILEIKDVGLNDSTSYECQVSTDPKMSMLINLHVLEHRSNSNGNRVHYSGGSYYVPNNKEVQRGRQPQQQHYGFDAATGLEIGDASSGAPSSLPTATVSQLLLWISFEMALAVAAINLLTANHRPSSALGSSFLDAS